MIFHTFEIEYEVVYLLDFRYVFLFHFIILHHRWGTASLKARTIKFLKSNFNCMIFRTFGTRNCVSTG